MQCIEGNVTGERMALLGGLPRRYFLVTNFTDAPRTHFLETISVRLGSFDGLCDCCMTQAVRACPDSDVFADPANRLVDTF